MKTVQPNTARPERHADNINRPPPWVDLAECTECGHDFRPDSSPSLVHCWQCVEILDGVR